MRDAIDSFLLSQSEDDIRAMAEAIRTRSGQSLVLAHALDALAAQRAHESRLVYRVEVWERGRLTEIMATTKNVAVANAAFEATKAERQKSFLRLMHGARILRQWPEERR